VSRPAGFHHRHSRDNEFNCLLHGVLGGAVKHHAVDDGPDNHATIHEFVDRIGNVLIVSTQTVHPTDDQGVARSEDIEESLALWPIRQPCADAGPGQRPPATSAMLSIGRQLSASRLKMPGGISGSMLDGGRYASLIRIQDQSEFRPDIFNDRVDEVFFCVDNAGR
jgi:hypothetical protein